jgi:hypothetical protein
MNGTRGKPPRPDLFERIEQQAMNDEAERILALTDEELDAELAAAGLDPAGVRARGRALGAELEAKYGRGPKGSR